MFNEKKNSYYNCRDEYQILRVYLNKDIAKQSTITFNRQFGKIWCHLSPNWTKEYANASWLKLTDRITLLTS